MPAVLKGRKFGGLAPVEGFRNNGMRLADSSSLDSAVVVKPMHKICAARVRCWHAVLEELRASSALPQIGVSDIRRPLWFSVEGCRPKAALKVRTQQMAGSMVRKSPWKVATKSPLVAFVTEADESQNFSEVS